MFNYCFYLFIFTFYFIFIFFVSFMHRLFCARFCTSCKTHILYFHLFIFVLFLFLLFLCVFAEYHRQFTVRNKIMFLFLFYFYFRILPASCNIKRTPPGHECIWGPATPPQEKTTAANSCTRVFYILYVQNFVKRCASTGTYHEKSCSGGSWILD